MKKYIDISPLISEKTAVFPGDTPFEREILLDFRKNDHLLLSSFRTTAHIGAHTDAPNHYHPEGEDIASRDLTIYFGKCQVIEIKKKDKKRIYPEVLAKTEIKATRILFKTGSFPDSEKWNADFIALSPELIEYLAEKGVILVGIDTPSVDPADSKELETHKKIYEKNLAIIEGLVLEKVAEGLYTLIALPLKISGADASPVRAILLPEETIFA